MWSPCCGSKAECRRHQIESESHPKKPPSRSYGPIISRFPINFLSKLMILMVRPQKKTPPGIWQAKEGKGRLGLVSETFEALGKGSEWRCISRPSPPPPSWGVIERPRIVGPAPPAPPHTLCAPSCQLCCAYTCRGQLGYTTCRRGSHHLLIPCWLGGNCVPILKCESLGGKTWETLQKKQRTQTFTWGSGVLEAEGKQVRWGGGWIAGLLKRRRQK